MPATPAPQPVPPVPPNPGEVPARPIPIDPPDNTPPIELPGDPMQKPS